MCYATVDAILVLSVTCVSFGITSFSCFIIVRQQREQRCSNAALSFVVFLSFITMALPHPMTWHFFFLFLFLRSNMRRTFFANGEYRPLVPVREEEECGNNQDLAPTGLQNTITRQWEILLIGAFILLVSIGYIGRTFLSNNGGSVLTSPMQFAVVHPIVQDDVTVDSIAW